MGRRRRMVWGGLREASGGTAQFAQLWARASDSGTRPVCDARRITRTTARATVVARASDGASASASTNATAIAATAASHATPAHAAAAVTAATIVTATAIATAAVSVATPALAATTVRAALATTAAVLHGALDGRSAAAYGLGKLCPHGFDNGAAIYLEL